MKTFEELFAELQAKAAAGNPESGTVKELANFSTFLSSSGHDDCQ